jgi:DNA-binding protein H-NS
LGVVVKPSQIASLSTNELWVLHEEINAALALKIYAEKKILEKRLKLLTGSRVQASRVPRRRPYPAVIPKFRNPANPSQTWAGRGKPPRWLTAQLKLGKRIDDFRIGALAA